MSNQTRPSVYLEEKCQTFSTVLKYFLYGNKNVKISDKLMSFLFQIDFWDWEIENLIFSFTNFQQRSDAWAASHGMAEYIRSKFGVVVNDDSWSESERIHKRQNKVQVVAPWSALNDVIEQWNALLKECEKRIMKDAQRVDNSIKLGAQLISNLDKYRKTMPCSTATNSTTSSTS